MNNWNSIEFSREREGLRIVLMIIILTWPCHHAIRTQKVCTSIHLSGDDFDYYCVCIRLFVYQWTILSKIIQYFPPGSDSSSYKVNGMCLLFILLAFYIVTLSLQLLHITHRRLFYDQFSLWQRNRRSYKKKSYFFPIVIIPGNTVVKSSLLSSDKSVIIIIRSKKRNNILFKFFPLNSKIASGSQSVAKREKKVFEKINNLLPFFITSSKSKSKSSKAKGDFLASMHCTSSALLLERKYWLSWLIIPKKIVHTASQLKIHKLL